MAWWGGGVGVGGVGAGRVGKGAESDAPKHSHRRDVAQRRQTRQLGEAGHGQQRGDGGQDPWRDTGERRRGGEEQVRLRKSKGQRQNRAPTKLCHGQQCDDAFAAVAKRSSAERGVGRRRTGRQPPEPRDERMRRDIEERQRAGERAEAGPAAEAHRVGHGQHADAHEDLD